MVDIAKLKQRIKESREGGGVSLSLENIGITSEELSQLVPRVQEEFPNLRILNLSGNNLTSLPESIGNFNNLTELNVQNNPLTNLPLGMVNLPTLTNLDLSTTALSLRSLLYVNAMNPQPTRIALSENHRQVFDQISGNSEENNSVGTSRSIAMSVAYTFPNTSAEEFNALYPLLSADQIRGIHEFSLPLAELGIGLDTNGSLSNQLNIDKPLSVLFDKADHKKTATTRGSKAKSEQEKAKEPGYLQRIADFDMMGNQDASKVAPREFTEPYVELANSIFGDIIPQSNLQQESTKDNVEQELVPPVFPAAASMPTPNRNSNVNFSAMTQPQNESQSVSALGNDSNTNANLDRKRAANVTGTEKEQNSQKRPKL
ncbi:leucine-rich repeat domain-containing protein [Ascidiimonas sp. W6]|uniref:leucine-rich repeat domain-containing protein n=1 Tax=Ascidiimonas meishanensis TaxID=3128903 RepID=UPI0030EDCF2B